MEQLGLELVRTKLPKLIQSIADVIELCISDCHAVVHVIFRWGEFEVETGKGGPLDVGTDAAHLFDRFEIHANESLQPAFEVVLKEIFDFIILVACLGKGLGEAVPDTVRVINMKKKVIALIHPVHLKTIIWLLSLCWILCILLCLR